MVNPPDLGICLRYNSDAIDLFRFPPPIRCRVFLQAKATWRIKFSGLPWLRVPLFWSCEIVLALVNLFYLPILSVSSYILRLLGQVRCGLTNRSFRSLGLLRKS